MEPVKTLAFVDLGDEENLRTFISPQFFIADISTMSDSDIGKYAKIIAYMDVNGGIIPKKLFKRLSARGEKILHKFVETDKGVVRK